MYRKLELDGIRGLAVLLVVFHHLIPLAKVKLPYLIELPVKFGHFGVDIFFVLSGYLITNILIKDLKLKIGSYFKQFYWKRLLRIFPIYYLVIFLTYHVFPIISQQFSVAEISKYEWYYWLYLGNFASFDGHIANKMFSMNHFWSLAIEEQYYLFWPLVVYLLKDSNKIMRAALVGIILVTLFRTFGSQFFDYRALYRATFFRLDLIFAGSYLAAYFSQDRRFEILDRYKNIAIIGSLIVIVGYYIVGANVNSKMSAVFLFPVVLIGCFFLVYSAVCEDKPKWMTKIFTSSLLIHFGTISYGFYVYHGWLRPAFENIQTACFPSGQIGSWVGFVFSFLLSWLISLASFYFVEKKLLKFKHVIH